MCKKMILAATVEEGNKGKMSPLQMSIIGMLSSETAEMLR